MRAFHILFALINSNVDVILIESRANLNKPVDRSELIVDACVIFLDDSWYEKEKTENQKPSRKKAQAKLTSFKSFLIWQLQHFLARVPGRQKRRSGWELFVTFQDGWNDNGRAWSVDRFWSGRMHWFEKDLVQLLTLDQSSLQTFIFLENGILMKFAFPSTVSLPFLAHRSPTSVSCSRRNREGHGINSLWILFTGKTLTEESQVNFQRRSKFTDSGKLNWL